jgi:RecJ-like exonuclease
MKSCKCCNGSGKISSSIDCAICEGRGCAPESEPIRGGMVIIVKTVADDFLQAAQVLLEKGCFFGSVVVLCCSAFESAFKWKIRFLLKKTGHFVDSKVDDYLNDIRRNSNQPLIYSLADEFEKLYGNGIRTKLLALPYWNDLDDMVKMRNKIVHTGLIQSGSLPTKEDAHKCFNISRKALGFLDKEIRL